METLQMSAGLSNEQIALIAKWVAERHAGRRCIRSTTAAGVQRNLAVWHA